MHSVLIVDDDSLSREVLSLLLEAEGYHVTSASNGEEALTLLATLSLAGDLPNAILADLQMPGLAGNALAEKLRALYGNSVQLVVMSAGEPEPSGIAAYDRFLRKPIRMESLASALKSSTQSRSTSLTEVYQPNAHILDESIYTKLAAAMNAQQVIEVYSFFAVDARHRIERMRAALHIQDESNFRKEAHTLQGGCGMLGATEMRTLAASLEHIGFGSRTSLELDALLEDVTKASERLRSMLEARWRRES